MSSICICHFKKLGRSILLCANLGYKTFSGQLPPPPVEGREPEKREGDSRNFSSSSGARDTKRKIREKFRSPFSLAAKTAHKLCAAPAFVRALNGGWRPGGWSESRPVGCVTPLLSSCATRGALSAAGFFILHKMCADGMTLSCAHPEYLLMRKENIPGNLPATNRMSWLGETRDDSSRLEQSNGQVDEYSNMSTRDAADSTF